MPKRSSLPISALSAKRNHDGAENEYERVRQHPDQRKQNDRYPPIKGGGADLFDTHDKAEAEAFAQKSHRLIASCERSP